jgi:hypothetical protein
MSKSSTRKEVLKVEDIAKKGGMVVRREDSALREFAGGSAGLARLEYADDDAFSDPAFYLKYPDRGSGEGR